MKTGLKFPYYFFIALRYLRSKKRHKGLSFNTAISIGGVAVGVMALLVVLSVMSGFHEDLQKKILGANAHLVVLNYRGFIKEQDLIMNKLKAEGDILSSAPFVLGQVMISSGEKGQGVYIRGIDPVLETKTTEIAVHIKEGSMDRLMEEGDLPGIIIGKELSGRLGLFINDKVNILSPMTEIGPLGMIPRVKTFKVVGIFEMGMFEFDSNLVMTNLKATQDFFEMGNAITGIEVRLKDPYRAPEVRQRLQKGLGYPYFARDWMQMNRNLFSALRLEKFAMFIILVLIVLVASFNIVSNLMMNVMEKEREIAILKAMGATNRGIMKVFMIQGFLIGLIGTVIGIVGGLGLAYVINKYQIIKLPPDIYYLSHLPVKVKLFDFIIVSLSAIIISLLATLYPALQAAKLDPVEPLRYE